MRAEISENADVQNRHPALELKHDVFLSHSGKDKDFTGLLFERLTDRGYCPFFDSDRSRSLRPGENASVPDVLFAAARQCRVLIVIVSEEFFTNSEWPMLELSAFVESQKEELEKGKSGNKSHAASILPVYLGLTRDQTKDKGNWEKWCRKWSEMEKKEKEKADKRTGSGKPLIDIKQWKEALQVLAEQSGKYTSCEYSRASGYTGLLVEIMSAVCGRVAPRNVFPDPAVQGREPICKAINQKIEESQKTKDGVCIVGLYGMAGIGKTTFCKELCALKYCEFKGKVCHAELKSLDSGALIELRKEVMRKLTNINPRDIQDIQEEKITDLGRVREETVFLALDNVNPESDSLGEARKLLDIWRNPKANVSVDNGTIVIVTAQSIDTLGYLEIERRNCLEMPDLGEEEAKSLFLSYAAPNCELKSEDDENIRYCVRLCYFSKGGIIWHYHPLALKVLGAQLRSYPNPSTWVKNLSTDDKFNQMHEKEHPIFRILRRGYDMLPDEYKLLFVDVVLFNPDWRNYRFRGTPNDHGAKFFDWLLIVHHKRNLASIKKGLQVLKERAVIVDAEDVSVHDLFFDFAKMEAKIDHQDVARWVWCSGDVVPDILEKTPRGRCWENVERVSLRVYHEKKGCKKCEELSAFRKALWCAKRDARRAAQIRNGEETPPRIGYDEEMAAKVGNAEDMAPQVGNDEEIAARIGNDAEISARIDEDKNEVDSILTSEREDDLNNYQGDVCHAFGDCKGSIEGINWKCFANVVVLEFEIPSSLNLDLSALGQRLRSLKIDVRGGTLVGLEKLRNLQWLDSAGIHYATCVDIGCLTMLQLLRFKCSVECNTEVSQALELHNVEKCIRLQELVLRCGCLKAFPDLRGMRSLRKVDFNGCRYPTEVLGLGPQLSKLEELRLIDCKSLRRLPNLAGLVSMQVLEVSESCLEVQQFLGLDTMTRLQVLTIKHAHQLLELPQLADLIALERLYLTCLPKVREFPKMHHLTKLQRITLRHCPQLIQQPELGEKVCLRYFYPTWCCYPLPDHGCCGGALLASLDDELLSSIDDPSRMCFDLSSCHVLSREVTGYRWV